MVQETNGKNYFDLKNFFSLLKDNIKIILVWMCLGFVISLVFSLFFVTPKYTSSVDILVNQKSDNEQSQFTTQQADLQVINTYKDVLKKSVILNPVLKEAKQTSNYQGSLAELEDAVSISNENQSQVITVTVADSNAYTARDIANTIGTVFTKKIKAMMKVNNVTIVSKAKVNTKPVSPNKPLNIVIGLFVGLIIGFLIVIIKKLFDTKVRESEFLTDELDLTSLGVVFHMQDKNNFHVVKILEKRDLSSEERNIPRRRV